MKHGIKRTGRVDRLTTNVSHKHVMKVLSQHMTLETLVAEPGEDIPGIGQIISVTIEWEDPE
jgi:hypothetical protein